MRPVRYWFNGGYADFQVPEGSDDTFQGNLLRIGGTPPISLRVTVLRTRSAREGGPATAEEALRLTRFAGVGRIEPLQGRRAVLSHVLPPEEGGDNLVSHVWHLAVPGPDRSVVVAIFSVLIDPDLAAQPSTTAALESLAVELRASRFVFFNAPASERQADLEDG